MPDTLHIITEPFTASLGVRDLAVRRGYRTLFSQVSFALEFGQCLHLTGANGAGKTTLLRCILGLCPPEKGHIYWLGKLIDRQVFYADLCYIGHKIALKDDLTARENLLSYGLSVKDVEQALRSVQLWSRADLPCKFLSQGQRRRVQLSRLVVSKQRFWLLDEPLVALDQLSSSWLLNILEKHVREGGMLLFTSHQAINIAQLQTFNLDNYQFKMRNEANLCAN